MKKIMYGLICLQLFCLSQGIWAQESNEAPPPREQGWWQTLFMMAIAAFFFYFIMMRPEQKRRKALEDQRSALKKGDKVVAMGIIGTVIRIEDQTVILKMYDGSTKIQFLKGAISEVLPGTDEDQKKAEKEERNLQEAEKK